MGIWADTDRSIGLGCQGVATSLSECENSRGLTSSHSGNLALVARLDEKPDVCVHEGDGHRDLGAVRENMLLVGARLLNVGEDLAGPTSQR